MRERGSCCHLPRCCCCLLLLLLLACWPAACWPARECAHACASPATTQRPSLCACVHASRCGIRINMQPYNYLLAHGEDPVTAYQKTYADIMRNIEFRTWCVGARAQDARHLDRIS